jgi:hypothetical protein
MYKSRNSSAASDPDPFNFIEGNVVAPPIVKLGGSRGLMISDMLSHFEAGVLPTPQARSDGCSCASSAKDWPCHQTELVNVHFSQGMESI